MVWHRVALFWLLLVAGVALLALDTHVRRVDGEPFWKALLYINSRDMEFGVWLSAITCVCLAVGVESSSEWWAVAAPAPAVLATWWLLSRHSPRNTRHRRRLPGLHLESTVGEPHSNVRETH